MHEVTGQQGRPGVRAALCCAGRCRTLQKPMDSNLWRLVLKAYQSERERERERGEESSRETEETARVKENWVGLAAYILAHQDGPVCSKEHAPRSECIPPEYRGWRGTRARGATLARGA